MDSGDIAKKLAKLAPREKEVLHLKCQGLKGPAIGERLGITESTVKSHMGHVYDKLGLSELGLSKSELWEQLFKVYCPVFQQNWVEVTQPGPTPEDNLALQLVPSEKALALAGLSDDLVPWERPEPPTAPRKPDEGLIIDGHVSRPAPQLPPPTGAKPKTGPNPFLMLLAGAMLGIILVLIIGGLAWWVFIKDQKTLPVALVSATPTLVLATPTPVVNVATAAPVMATVLVVVTATPPPVSDTPQPSPTVIRATSSPPSSDTPVPTATATAAVQLPFSDNFNNNWNSAWQWTAGSWATKGGALTALPDQSGSYIWFYIPADWKDFRVSVRLDDREFGVPFGYPLAVAVRYSPTDPAPLAFVCDTWNCGWGRPSGSEPHYLEGSGPTVNAPLELKVEIKGNSIAAFINGALYQNYSLTDLPASGGIALGMRCPSVANSCPLFDNLLIEPLTP